MIARVTVSSLHSLPMSNKAIEFPYKIYVIDNDGIIYVFEFYSRAEGFPLTLGLPARLQIDSSC